MGDITCVHAIVTDNCRSMRGEGGVVEETMGRVRKALEEALKGWPADKGTEFHVTVAIHRNYER